MAVDPISPIAPARLRTLLLPIGRIRRSRFLELVKRLQAQNVVRLGDVSPVGRPNRNTFSPLAFPSGMIIYDLSTSVPPTSHLDLFPFEPFREPVAILAIADGKELEPPEPDELSQQKTNGVTGPPHPKPPDLDSLVAELSELKANYPHSLTRQLLIFDYKGVNKLVPGPDNVMWIPSPAVSRTTTIKTLMCDISSLILKELGDFSESMQEWRTIDSPTASSWGPRRTRDVRPTDKLKHRMTMPAQLPSQPNAPTSHHSDTELTAHARESPTTFDEITRSIQLANRATAALKSSSKPGSQEHSRERMSIHGPSSVNERSKTRFHARLKVVTGLLHLQAGIWPEAMKELVEGAIGARSGSDYIWHAKALESILICLLLYGWIGMDFQIPQVCFPSIDKPTTKPPPTPSHSEPSATSESRAACLKSLAIILPDISNYILSLYNRATNITDEPLPQFIYSETTIRLAKLLTVAYNRDGFLDDNALNHIVMGLPLESVQSSDRPRGYMALRKTEIASFLFQALPPSPATEIPITDSVQILVGMAAVLSQLGLERKRGFVLRELLTASITGLIQARKIGAADVGIHPAAGLSALNNEAFDLNALDAGSGNTEDSMRGLLALVASLYGAPSAINGQINRPDSKDTEGQPGYDSVEAIIERALNDSTLASYGDTLLKVDIFKACIDFCEALPNFEGVLQFTVGLLQTIKGSPMLAPNDNNIPPILAPEEQVRFYNNVKRTVGAANRLGHPDMEAEYWDDFMVRDIGILENADVKQPVQRSKKDFGMSVVNEDRGNKGPFIYSAFSKAPIGRSESLLVAGEQSAVKVVLQNPYEFDIEIERLRLDGSDVEFEAETHGLWLRPFSLEEKIIPLLATTEGTLKITGCIAKVRFCRQRHFPIFKKLWKPSFQPKLKRTGLAAKDLSFQRPLSWGSNESGGGHVPTQAGPEPDHLLVNVIKQQPLLEIESSSLLQNAIMLLEGQTSTFDITLRNVTSCPVDFIFFTFQDSTTRRLQTAISNKDNLPAEVYELEYQLSEIPALRWKRPIDDNGKITIAPKETSTFTIEVFGKPGLNDAEIQIDYGYTSVSSSEIPETFYTRQLNFPLTITVNPSIELVRCDILPFSPDFAWSNRHRHKFSDTSAKGAPTSTAPPSHSSKTEFSKMLSRIGMEPYGSDHCLLLLDLRNSWSNPLTASISVTENIDEINNSLSTEPSVHEVVDVLQSGRTTRLVVLVPRIFLDNPCKAIPSLGHANKRQFVVSARKVSYEAEVAGREAFWFREELLKRLSGTWKEDMTGRKGAIGLRGITLNSGIVDALRMDDIEITFSVRQPKDEAKGPSNTAESDCDSTSTVQTGYSKFTIPTNSFLTLFVTIFNRSSRPVHPLLRLVPSLRHQPDSVALELSKRFSWTGMLQRALPILGPRQTTEARLGITAFCRGEYEIGALVEEVRRLKAASSTESCTDGDVSENKDNGDTPNHSASEQERGLFLENLVTDVPNQRRVWHARAPCFLSARD
ncbi:hypothetical protein D8B26_000685 [Coccidioides posadasii str. Silveira]|uniref:Hypercellular protein HypA n=1 Tax=Coccidioides posadasii (strain RMSCC 757 / Silveira) TaxID=443226 RepID=E9D8K5_COCPS|nr:hypercellular protein HypA [Coccidioides posadasii str. Silveira]QVM05976.1 hypothetical protein D8B26_000685 [Coccidioides posadasii str. Silveira]